MFSFYLFRRYFLSSRSASLIKALAWICLAGLTVSVAALILIVSVMGGFGEAIKGRIASNEAHLIISFTDSPFPAKKTRGEGPAGQAPPAPESGGAGLLLRPPEAGQSGPRSKNPERPLPSMTEEQKAGIREIVFFEAQDLIVKSRLGFRGAEGKGYAEGVFRKIREAGQAAAAAQLPAPRKDFAMPAAAAGRGRPPGGEREILAGPDLFMEMGLHESERLSVIPLGALLFPPSMAPPVKRARALPLAPAAAERSGFFVFYRQGDFNFGGFSKIRYGAEIKLRDPKNYPVYKEIFKDYGAQSWADRNSTLFFALKLEKFIMTLFIALAFIISCFGISSALFLLITQKGKDLGMLHAMGMSKKELVRTFTWVGFSLSLLGIFSGLLAGLLGAALLKLSQFNILPEAYQDRAIPAIFEPASYLLIAVSSVLLAWLACYLPARHLSRIEPAALLKITGR